MARGRQRNPLIQQLVERFEKLPVDGSIFVPAIKPADVAFLRRPAVARGVGIAIWAVDRDEIYHQAGVRIKRKEGLYDQL